MIFFIGYNTPSSKNSKQYTGKGRLISSKSVRKWLALTEHQWVLQKEGFLKATKDLPRPLRIEVTFIKKTRNAFDFVNPLQTIQDAMKDFGWIEDDNTSQLLPYPGDDYVDKEVHGCFIRVLTTKPILQ